MELETVPGGAAEGSGGGGLGLDPHCEQLLPGFPDDFTLGEIVPKLGWKCLNKLASVSPAWLHAVRSREIYDARVIYRALESLVVLRSASLGKFYEKLGLYSTRDGFYLKLPSLLVPQGGFPSDGQCVMLDGAIYALGGRSFDFCHVYVLDLAGPRQWKQCASMLRQKANFTCAALDGKIYVVERDVETVRFSEVYDPKADTWCLIEPMPISPREGQIIAVGEELILLSLQAMDVANAAHEFEYMADVYNPAKDEWRVETFYSDEADGSLAILFEAQGKLHRVKENSISVLDMDTKRWTLKHSYVLPAVHDSRGVFGPFLGVRKRPNCVTAVGDEVMAIVGIRGCFPEDYLMQSEGFGGKDRDVTWRESKTFPSIDVREAKIVVSEPDDPTGWELYDLPFEIYPIKL